MATILQRLAGWARDLRIEDIPPSVLERARLQQLSVAGAVRGVADRPIASTLRAMGASRGGAPAVTGGTTSRRDAVRLHTALSGWLDFDDYLFMGNTGHGAVCGGWAWAKGHTVGDLLVAAVAANEVAGRVGASMLLGPNNGQAWAAVHAASTATSAGLLAGLDADELAHALALALSMPHRVPQATLLGGGMAKALAVATPAVQGHDAVEMAKAGATGPLSTLDDRDGVLGALSWVPLRNAFGGLGSAWLSQTLGFKLMPGCIYVHVPVQGLHEILRRHVKAADKRLRYDQIERIEISTTAQGAALARLASERGSWAPASIPYDVARSMGVLVVAHNLGPQQLSPDWLQTNRERAAHVSSKVHVHHDWARTMAMVEHMVSVAAPLFAGVTSAELRTAGMRASGTYGIARPGVGDLLSVLKVRPGAMLERIRYASHDLADAQLDQWQFRLDSEVRVHTTRGGTWPERREIPEGSPGWPWQRTIEGVHQKAAGTEEPVAVQAMAELGQSDVGADGPGFVGALLGR